MISNHALSNKNISILAKKLIDSMKNYGVWNIKEYHITKLFF
jgi:hypothetical protein